MSPAAGRSVDRGDVLHLVVPATVDDPLQPSGGNVYDRELARAWRSLGHRALVHPVGDGWPDPVDPPAAELHAVLATVPDGATVLVDGLLGLGAPEVLVQARRRLQVWLVVHLPLGLDTGTSPAVRARERRALAAAAGAITTSAWTRDWLVGAHHLDPARVRVARPGAHPAGPSTATREPGALLCVGALVPGKGQDVLLDALGTLRDLTWTCRLVGPLDRDPAYVDRLRAQVRDRGLAARVSFTGPLPRAGVDAALAAADLLVSPSRFETYGMVTTEALAHGLPVLATDTGGVAEALGATRDGRVPGQLVPPGDVPALGGALRRWLEDEGWRARLRSSAQRRRAELRDWTDTARDVRRAILEVPLNRRPERDVVRAWP